MKAFYYLYALAGCCALAGCQHEETKTAAAPVNTKPVVQQPFRYHKLIEVAPGLDYDVFSWGRGPAETGAYMILRSDSVDKQYTTTTGDLDGMVVDVFNTDLDTDGNPEIFIQSQTADSTRYGKIDAYEYNDDNARKLEFPKLTTRQKKGYHGGDDFVVKEDRLIRTYPIYDSDDKAARPTGQKRTLEYSYHGNSFSVKQLSTDSTVVATHTSTASSQSAPQPAKTEAPAKEQPAKQEEHHTSRRHESRHHEVSRHHKAPRHEESSRHRRRHRR